MLIFNILGLFHNFHLRMYELLLDFHSLKKEKLCETAGSSADIIN